MITWIREHLGEISTGLGVLGRIGTACWWFRNKLRAWNPWRLIRRVQSQMDQHESECLVVARENAERLDRLESQVSRIDEKVDALSVRNARVETRIDYIREALRDLRDR